DLLPAPREIRLSGERTSLAGWRIVTTAGSAMLQAAASEINSRIEELGGTALPAGTAPGGPAIVIGSAADPVIGAIAAELGARVSRESPGEQGYVIAFGRHG